MKSGMALELHSVASKRAAAKACTSAVAKFSDKAILTMKDARERVDTYKRIEGKKKSEKKYCRRDLNIAEGHYSGFVSEVDNIRWLCSRGMMIIVKRALRQRTAILYKFSFFVSVLALLSIALYYSPDPLPLCIVTVIVVVVFAPAVFSTSPNPDYGLLNDLHDCPAETLLRTSRGVLQRI